MEKELGWLLKEKYFGRPTKQFYKDIKRLNGAEPLDYVIGFTEFLSCKIDLSKRPLIPRPETEFWVDQAIKSIVRPVVKSALSRTFHDRRKIRALDIFCGSGCIGIALLKNMPGLLCDMADNDKNAIAQIKINYKLNQPSPEASAWRSKIIKSDVFKNIRNKYDYIFANPPYIPTTQKNKIQKSVLKFEPSQALFGGADGLFYIKKFLKEAKKYLNPDGKIFMEFSPDQKAVVKEIILKNKYSNYKFNKDQYGKWRWIELGF